MSDHNDAAQSAISAEHGIAAWAFRPPFMLAIISAALLMASILIYSFPAQAQSSPGNVDVPNAISPEVKARLEKLQQDLATARSQLDADAESKTLTEIAGIYGEAGDNQKALEHYNKALDIEWQTGYLRDQAATLNSIGNIYSEMGKMRALDYFNQALLLEQKENDRSNMGMTLDSIGRFYSRVGKTQKALDFFNQAFPIRREVHDGAGEAATLTHIGFSHQRLGQPYKALDYYNQALAIQQEIRDRKSEAVTLTCIGDIYSDLGQPQKALEYLNKALPIRREVHDSRGEAVTLDSLGGVYAGMGQPEKALDYFNTDLPIRRLVNDPRGEAVTLDSIGDLYFDLGLPQEALDYYNRGLFIRRSLDERRGEAVSLNDIGNSYSVMGQPKKALEFFNQALAIEKGIGDRRGEALTLNRIGSAYSDLNEPRKALEHFNQALEIAQQIHDLEDEATALYHLGKIYDNLGEREKGLISLQHALLLAVEVEDPLKSAACFHQLMLHWRNERPYLAAFYGKQSVSSIQQVRSNIRGLANVLQKHFLSTHEAVYRELAELLIEQGRLPEAQEIIDLMKEQEFQEFTRSKKGGNTHVSFSPAEQRMDEEYEKKTRGLIAKYEEWSALKKKTDRSKEEEERFAALLREIEEGVAQFESLLDYLDRILQNAEKEKLDRARDDIRGLKDLVESLGDDAAALYTLVVGDRYRVIFIRSKHALVERSTIISAKELHNLANEFITQLSNKHDAQNSQTESLIAVSAKLYQVLIGPVADELQEAHVHTLVWELDGVLHYIPMAALYDMKRHRFLVDEYANVIITPANHFNLKDVTDFKRARLLAVGLSRKYEDGFDALENVPAELGSIVHDPNIPSTKGLLPGTEWLDDLFTEKNFQNELSSHSYKIVHIASHFNADPAGDRLKSFLLLAGQDVGGIGFHLTLSEMILNPNLDMHGVELLTLSACKTGIASKAQDGHEIDGLGGVGQDIGAHSVIASLWEVNDKSTSSLMTDFYQHWVAGSTGMEKVEALRQAQYDLLHGNIMPDPVPNAPSSYTHPYYWAPFILMGNWR